MNPGEAQARLIVALNALAAIAQELGVPAGAEHGADWVGGITAAIRAKIALVTPSIAARGGLVALSAALTRPQAEHPDVQEACTWIAYITEHGAPRSGFTADLDRAKIDESRALVTNYQRAIGILQNIPQSGMDQSEREETRQHYDGEAKRCKEFLGTSAPKAPPVSVERALRDISAALGVEGEPLSVVVAAAWTHAGYREARLEPDDAHEIDYALEHSTLASKGILRQRVKALARGGSAPQPGLTADERKLIDDALAKVDPDWIDHRAVDLALDRVTSRGAR